MDLLWFLALPIFLTIGTAIHEGAHLIVAVTLGVPVFSVSIIPNSNEWGAVRLDPRGLTDAIKVPILLAPYFLFLLLYLASSVAAARVTFTRRWVGFIICCLGLGGDVPSDVESRRRSLPIFYAAFFPFNLATRDSSAFMNAAIWR